MSIFDSEVLDSVFRSSVFSGLRVGIPLKIAGAINCMYEHSALTFNQSRLARKQVAGSYHARLSQTSKNMEILTMKFHLALHASNAVLAFNNRDFIYNFYNDNYYKHLLKSIG